MSNHLVPCLQCFSVVWALPEKFFFSLGYISRPHVIHGIGFLGERDSMQRHLDHLSHFPGLISVSNTQTDRLCCYMCNNRAQLASAEMHAA